MTDAHLYVIDSSTVVLLADVDLPATRLGSATSSNLDGGDHLTATLFFTFYVRNRVIEYEPSTGSVVNEFALYRMERPGSISSLVTLT